MILRGVPVEMIRGVGVGGAGVDEGVADAVRGLDEDPEADADADVEAWAVAFDEVMDARRERVREVGGDS